MNNQNDSISDIVTEANRVTVQPTVAKTRQSVYAESVAFCRRNVNEFFPSKSGYSRRNRRLLARLRARKLQHDILGKE